MATSFFSLKILKKICLKLDTFSHIFLKKEESKSNLFNFLYYHILSYVNANITFEINSNKKSSRLFEMKKSQSFHH